MAGVMEKIMGKNDEEMRLMQECECTMSGLKLKEDGRKIWDDHVFWTREVVLTAAVGDAQSPMVGAAVARLMKNQEDIGDSIVPFYGEEAGTQPTALLKDHVKYAIDVVLAAKKGEAENQKIANDAWYTNAADISTFLSDANPKYWPYQAVLDMMNEHLRLTTEEAASMLQGNWDKAVTST